MATDAKSYAKELFERKPYGVLFIFIVGAAFVLLRMLLDSTFRTTTLVYIATPFGLSILLHFLIDRAAETSTLKRYLNHLRDATIIMLATSAILFEGFVCVIMFMPIYYFFMTVGFIFTWLLDKQQERHSGKIGAYGVSAIVALACLEGLADPLTVERDSDATYTAIVSGDIPTLKQRMAQPITFSGDRHWFLSVFPLPTKVKAGSLIAGDVHHLQFVYKRWFFTNTHEGELHLKIAEVGDDLVRTEVVSNTSYLASYLTIEGTEVRFTELNDGQTRVALTIKYQRLLDPYWYFGPLQKFAAEQSAKYLIESVIDRKPTHG